MAKEPKKTTKVKEQIEEIAISEIIQDDVVEEIVPIKEAEPYRMSAAEEAEYKMLKEQKRKRFEQLAGVNETPTLEEQNDVPVRVKKPNKLKLTLLSEGLRKQVKALIKEGKTKVSEFPEEVKKRVIKEMSMAPEGVAMCDPMSVSPVQEDGAAAVAMDQNAYPELDGYISKLTLGVQNLITKELNKTGEGEDPEFPYKAEYIVSGLIKGLQAQIQA